MKTSEDEIIKMIYMEYPQGIRAMKFMFGDWIDMDITKEIVKLILLYQTKGD